MSRTNDWTFPAILLLQLFGFAFPAHSQGTKLTIKITASDSPSTGVQSIVSISDKTFDTNSKGIVVVNISECNLDLKISYIPEWPYMRGQTECTSNPLEINARYIESVESYMGSIKNNGVETLNNPEAAALSEDILASISGKNYAAVAKNANEISAILRKSGDIELAKKYSSMAIEFGFQSMVGAYGSAASPAIAYDPNQSSWVMTDTGKQALEDFQARQGLPSDGVWGPRTFESLAER